jgi:beta-lactamase class A
MISFPEFPRMFSRRAFAKTSLATFLAGDALSRLTFATETGFGALAGQLAKIGTESGGRLGVAVLDIQSGAAAGHRADERFPICSTFKMLAAAAVLTKVDAGKEQLSRRIRVEQNDILAYAPMAAKRLGADASLGELCEAAVTLSDNTAANLILAQLGGPSAVTQFARSLGDEITRLDRNEPDVNEATPGDPRDTSTPAAMASDLKLLTAGTALSQGSRDQLIAWLVGCKTGNATLRAGLPNSWRVGDKTGAGEHGTRNDIAVVWPPNRAPLIIASYLTETTGSDDARNATHAAVARAVADTVAG